MKKRKQQTKIAICYDFDGTLSPDIMQEVSFIPSLGMSSAEFWAEVKQNARESNMDEILAYMNLMIAKAAQKKQPMTLLALTRHGKKVRMFKGVDSWFSRINQYAASLGLQVEHYVISSGVEEIIRGTSIGKKFNHIFACRFMYHDRRAVQPATAVNYTNKTQFLFRINKGIFNYYENDAVNQYMPDEEKYVNFSNMIYIGDGATDVPCMKMVMYQGGKAIAVYNPEKKAREEIRDADGKVIFRAKKSAKEMAMELYKHNRADFIAPTDYSENSRIETIVKNIIDGISVQAKCIDLKKQIDLEIAEDAG